MMPSGHGSHSRGAVARRSHQGIKYRPTKAGTPTIATPIGPVQNRSRNAPGSNPTGLPTKRNRFNLRSNVQL